MQRDLITGPSDEQSAKTDAINPYAVTTAAASQVNGEAWPLDLPLKKSRRVRQLAKDADRAALSLIGAIFLGLAGPIVFTIFFVGHLLSHDRLTREFPDLMCPPDDNPVAISFAAARKTFVTWAGIYGSLLVIVFIVLASHIFA